MCHMLPGTPRLDCMAFRYSTARFISSSTYIQRNVCDCIEPTKAKYIESHFLPRRNRQAQSLLSKVHSLYNTSPAPSSRYTLLQRFVCWFAWTCAPAYLSQLLEVASQDPLDVSKQRDRGLPHSTIFDLETAPSSAKQRQTARCNPQSSHTLSEGNV